MISRARARARRARTERVRAPQGVANREPESRTDGMPSLLKEFAGDVIDGGDMISDYGVTHAQTVGQQRSANHDRMAVKVQKAHAHAARFAAIREV
jgi:hypothetical protein